VRIVQGADEGRRTLLRRTPLGQTALPDSIRKKNQAVFGADLPVEDQVRRVLADVQREGDVAVARYTRAFTGAAQGALEVSRDEIDAAYGNVAEGLVSALIEAAEHIREYHERQR